MRTISERVEACIQAAKASDEVFEFAVELAVSHELYELKRECARICWDYSTELKVVARELKIVTREYEAIGAGECGLRIMDGFK